MRHSTSNSHRSCTWSRNDVNISGRSDEGTSGSSHVRVGHENVHTVLRILLVLALRLKHESLEDVIVPRDHAVRVY